MKNEFFFFFAILGALNDFDAANGAKSTEKNVEPSQGNANAEIWNEEFIA